MTLSFHWQQLPDLQLLFGTAIASAVQEKTFLAEANIMLWTICVVLFILWALGMVTSYTMGGVIHILLVVALVILLLRLFQGRRSIV